MSFKGSIKIDRVHFVVSLFLLRSNDNTQWRIRVVDKSRTPYFQQGMASVQPRSFLKKIRGDSLADCFEGRAGWGGGGCTQANKTSNQISRSPILSNQHIDRAEKGLLESLLRHGVGDRKTSFSYRSKIA